MEGYRIGRIQGRWENMVPPIQGGKFDGVGEEESSSSSSSSEGEQNGGAAAADGPPPILQDKDRRTPQFRHRKPENGTAHLPPTKEPALVHMDARTREEITLDASIYPPLDPAVQDAIVRKYRALDGRIRAAGLYQCTYSSYLPEILRYALLFTASMTLLHFSQYALSALALGLFWHQLVFTAHDAGHMGITHGFHADSTVGILVADLLGGLSLGWWKRNHNVHHIVTNAPEHDPDIQHMPFLAVSHRFLQSLPSTYYDRVLSYDVVARAAVRVQHWTYFFLLLFGRFNLYALSYTHLLTRLLHPRASSRGPARWHHRLELLCVALFWLWFGYGLLYLSVPAPHRLPYLLVSHLATAPVHAQIALSHFAMSTADAGPRESFPQRMLRTTMDVDCPAWLDWVHGGLQFQAVHHLFPRIPRHNLRRAQALVVEFCEDVGIPYAVFGFVDGNRKVLGRLEEVARMACLLGAVQGELARDMCSPEAR
jgi:sphingolipid 8-(E)-desaturase